MQFTWSENECTQTSKSKDNDRLKAYGNWNTIKQFEQF